MQNPHRIFRRALLGVGIGAALLSAGCQSSTPDSQDKPAVAAKAEPPPGPAEFVVPLCPNAKCGVFDSHGKLLVPFEHGYENVMIAFAKDHVLALKDGQWSLFDVRSGQKLKDLATSSDDLYTLPGGELFGFKRDGKIGLIDEQGKDVQPPHYDDLFAGGHDQYIGYVVNGKNGLLDLQGKVLAEPLYDELAVNDDFDRYGGLVDGKRGEQEWLVNLKDGSQKQVSYSRLSKLADGHMVASDDAGKQGLADAKGELTIPLKYEWLGTPGAGLVAFREAADQPCGYLDYQGKVAIAAKFASCEPFGQHGALAKAQPASEGAESKFGVIGRDGQWLAPPGYDYADSAGRTTLGMLNDVPGLTLVGHQVTPLQFTWGIYDTDHGREVLAPKYDTLGALTADRFVFSDAQSPHVDFTLLGDTQSVPAIGVMDAAGKVLLKPEQFVDIQLDKNGRYLVAEDGAAVPHQALYDLDGHQLVPPQWNELKIDPVRRAIFAYAVDGTGDDANHELRAVYDLQGKPLFQSKTTACGAEQVLDGDGKVIWPQDPTPYCPKPDAGASG